MKSIKASKKLISVFVILTLIFVLSVTVYAENPRVVDSAGLFTESQKAELEGKVDETISLTGVDMVIVTTDSTDGKTSEAYSDDYFDYNGYGIGEERNGMLFLINMQAREMHISLRGSETNFFSDWDIENAFDIIQPYASSGEYAEAAETFLEYVQSTYNSANSYDESYGYAPEFGMGPEQNPDSEMVPDINAETENEAPDPSLVAVIAVIVGLGAGGIVCFLVRSKYKMKFGGYKYPYLQKSSLRTRVRSDTLIDKHITQQRIRDSNDRNNHRGSFGGGSGGTIHTSSSGASHRGSTRGF